MSFYSEFTDTATQMLAEFGADVILRRFTPGGGNAYDPSTGKAVSNAQTAYQDYTRKGLLVDAPGSRMGPEYGENLKSKSLIQDRNKWMYLEVGADGIAPRVQDFIIVKGIQFKIFDVQTVGPGNVDIMYILVLRA